MKFIIAIDPGNNTGLTYGFADQKPITELHDFTPKGATKGSKKNPGRKAEEKHIRYGKLWFVLSHICSDIFKERDFKLSPEELVIICEGAAGFTKGKSAVEVSNKYRGVVEAFAAIRQCQYIGIQPNDLQRWATGKGRAEKTEMLKVASERFGYQGTDDNEGDSVLLWHFAKNSPNISDISESIKILDAGDSVVSVSVAENDKDFLFFKNGTLAVVPEVVANHPLASVTELDESEIENSWAESWQQNHSRILNEAKS